MHNKEGSKKKKKVKRKSTSKQAKKKQERITNADGRSRRLNTLEKIEQFDKLIPRL